MAGEIISVTFQIITVHTKYNTWKKSVMWEKPAIDLYMSSVRRDGVILERKNKYIMQSLVTCLKDARSLSLFLNFVLFLHNQTHRQPIQAQRESDSGEGFTTVVTPNDFHPWRYCFKFMKPTLPVCTFIFPPSFPHVYKRGTTCHKILKKLHKGTRLYWQRGTGAKIGLLACGQCQRHQLKGSFISCWAHV